MTHFILFLAGGMLFCVDSRATPLEEAESSFSQAQNQYFEALIQGPPKNETEKNALHEKILGPAIRNLNQALEESNQNFASRYVRIVSEEDFKTGLKKAEREQESFKVNDDPRVPPPYMKAVVDQIFSPQTQPQKESKIIETQKPLIKNEPVIDEKEVPDEIKFPGVSPSKKPDSAKSKSTRAK